MARVSSSSGGLCRAEPSYRGGGVHCWVEFDKTFKLPFQMAMPIYNPNGRIIFPCLPRPVWLKHIVSIFISLIKLWFASWYCFPIGLYSWFVFLLHRPNFWFLVHQCPRGAPTTDPLLESVREALLMLDAITQVVFPCLFWASAGVTTDTLFKPHHMLKVKL